MLNKKEIERNILILIKSTYEKSTDNMIFNGERMNYFPLRSGIKQGRLILLSLFHITRSSGQCNKTTKGNKGQKSGKKEV